MFADLFTNTEQLVVTYGVWGVFVASLLEEVIVPIPSALIMLGAGFFFLDKDPISWSSILTLVTNVALPAAIGTTTGSLLIYGIGYVSGKPALERWGKYFGISWRDIERAQEFFSRGWGDELLLVTVRSVPVVPGVAVSAFCGLVRLPLREYLFYSVIGTFLRAMIMGFIGWQVGNLYIKTASGFQAVEQLVLLLVAVVAIALVVHALFLRKKKQ